MIDLTPTEGPTGSAEGRHIIREIAWRFAYLRRVVIHEMSRVLSPLKVTVPQYHVLFRLATSDGPLSQQELTLDAGLDAAGVSRMVARMAEEKLVIIKIDSRDRRRRLVRLTPKGRALEESLSPLIDTAVRNMVPGWNDHEASLLLHVLERVCAATMAREQAPKKRIRKRNAMASRSNPNSIDV
jgi:DNA-binding MarR family transcriptional regulator